MCEGGGVCTRFIFQMCCMFSSATTLTVMLIIQMASQQDKWIYHVSVFETEYNTIHKEIPFSLLGTVLLKDLRKT